LIHQRIGLVFAQLEIREEIHQRTDVVERQTEDEDPVSNRDDHLDAMLVAFESSRNLSELIAPYWARPNHKGTTYPHCKAANSCPSFSRFCFLKHHLDVTPVRNRLTTTESKDPLNG